MSKKIKIFLLVVLTGFSLAGAGIWYAAANVDPAQLTQLLSSTIKGQTGRDLKIAGPMKLSFFPNLAVSADQVSLSNASWASNPEMVHVQNIALIIKWLPLLSKKIEVDSIILNGVNLTLQTNNAGDGNWVLTTPTTQSVPGVSGGSSNADLSANLSANPGDSSSNMISLENLTVNNAQITYQSANASKQTYEVSHLSLIKGDGKTKVDLNASSLKRTLIVKGQMTSIPKIVSEWGVSPLNVNLDLEVSLNGKTLEFKGDLEKSPNALTKVNLVLNSKAFDVEPLAGGAVLASSNGQAPAVPAKSRGDSKYFFSDDPLPFSLLPQATGSLVVNIDQLDIPGYSPLKALKGILQFKGDEIAVTQLTFQMGNGQAQLQGNVSKFQEPSPVLFAKGYASNFTLEKVLASTNSGAKLSGGDIKVAFDLKGSGMSLHQLLARSTGKVQVSIGQATLPSNLLNNGGDFVITLLDAVNPLRKKTTETVLECAVAYLPITQGQVNIANSVGVQTDRLNVVLAGNVNLATEAVNLNIYPSEKSGLTTGLDLANLVKLQGTLLQPKTGINQAGVVNSALSIGLGFLTGGATIVAENAKSLTSKEQPCRDALHPWSDIYPGAN